MDDARRRRAEANWSLRRRAAKLHAEFDFLSREVLQLSQKRFLKPAVESIELTEAEEKFLNDLKERKLKEVISKHCLSVVKFLMSQKLLSYPFNEPVDTVTYRDYLNYVRTPMDFGTIKGKITQYKTPAELEADVRLVFENARKYNAPETDVREMARLLEAKFDEKWTKTVLPRIEELKTAEVDDRIAFKQTKADGVIVEAETRVDECCRLLLNRLQTLAEEIRQVQCYAATQCQTLTEHDQLRLGWELSTLPPDQFQHAVNLVLMRHPGLIATMRDNTINFDINKMDALTLRQLQDYVRYCRKERERSDDDTGPESVISRKRLRRTSANGSSVESTEQPRSSLMREHGVHWPSVAYGIGLKLYPSEVVAFIPPNAEDSSALQFPTNVLNNSYSCASTELEAPMSTAPVAFRVEESAQSIQNSRMASNQQLTASFAHGNQMNLAFTHQRIPDIPTASKLLSPSVFSRPVPNSTDAVDSVPASLSVSRELSTKTESQHPSIDLSELTPPTVRVSSAGLAAIPLVPASQPTGLFPSFFTANIQPRLPTTTAAAIPASQLSMTSSPLPIIYPNTGLASSQAAVALASAQVIDLTKTPASSE